LRTVLGGRAKDSTAASTSEMARFETETLSTKENLKHLMDRSGKWIDQAHRPRKLTKLILEMDSSVSETYGHQEGSAYNGHFGCTCYHPLFLFNQFGDLERVMLRRGNLGRRRCSYSPSGVVPCRSPSSAACRADCWCCSSESCNTPANNV